MAELERKAGYGLVIALSVTAMIGTGAFFGPALAATYAGNASIISWIILSIISIYVGSCFAELSSIFPDAGGVYEFAKRAYGRFYSFMVGWITWLVGSITPALIIVAALDFLMPSAAPLNKLLISAVLIIMLNYVALRGIESSTALLLFFAFITVALIIAVLVGGSFKINPQNYTPLFSTPALGILVALFFILESSFGWESATFMGGETKNPEKVIPKSIMITSIIVGILVVLSPVVILGFVPWQTLISFDVPLTTIAFFLFGETGKTIITIAVFLALVGSAAGGIVSSPRLILALAKDKLFIEQFSAVHPKYKTPHKAILFQVIVSLLIAVTALGNYQFLLSLLVPMALIMYIGTLMTIPRLRKKYPDRPRTIKAPFGFIGPVFISVFYLAIIIIWLITDPAAISTFQRIISFILFGIPIYLLLNMYYNPDLLTKTLNSFAPLSKALENILLPQKMKEEILNIFQSLKNKTVLEFGCGVGTFSLPLSQRIGNDGKLYIVELSKKNIDILEKRIIKHKVTNIQIIHDEHLISRVHPDIPSVDMIFSIGNLSYLQNLQNILKDMNRLLPENGQFCFVEYVNYFWGVLPNQVFLDDHEKLKQIFKKAGFSIRIKKERGFFWNYLFVYGIKSDYDVPVI